MEDIDAMFSDLLGEMDLLTKVSLIGFRGNNKDDRFILFILI